MSLPGALPSIPVRWVAERAAEFLAARRTRTGVVCTADVN
jgi:hypothetical protein